MLMRAMPAFSVQKLLLLEFDFVGTPPLCLKSVVVEKLVKVIFHETFY